MSAYVIEDVITGWIMDQESNAQSMLDEFEELNDDEKEEVYIRTSDKINDIATQLTEKFNKIFADKEEKIKSYFFDTGEKLIEKKSKSQ